jgi:hypothetical protein
MAGYSNGLFAIGASGEYGDGQHYNVVYTTSPTGTLSPTLIPNTGAAGGYTVVQPAINSMLMLGGLLIAVLVLVMVLKK